MVTKTDQQFLRKFFEDIERLNAMEIDNVERYREVLPALLEERKNRDPLPEVGEYHEAVQIEPHFTAGIAVPKSNSNEPFPVMLMSHGHGGLHGSAHSYRRFTRDMAAGGYLCVTPDYRLAPEHRHPAGLEDLIACAHWIKRNAKDYGGDGSRIIVCGDSIGAGFALSAVLHLLAESDAPDIRAFVGLEGVYARSRAEGFFVDALMPEGFTDKDLEDPAVSPVFGIKEGMELPPMFLMTGSADFASPANFHFAGVLAEKHIPFEMHVLEGMVHDFTKFPDLDGCQEAHRLMFSFLSAHP